MSKRLTPEMLRESQGHLDNSSSSVSSEESSFSACYRFCRHYFLAELIIGSIFLLSEAIALAIVTFENADDSYRSLRYQVRDRSIVLDASSSSLHLYKDWSDFAPHINRILQMRELIIAQIVCYAVQLMIQFIAIRTHHRRFYSGMFLPIILNLFICCALVALELTFFCAPLFFSLIDLILTFVTIKSLT